MVKIGQEKMEKFSGKGNNTCFKYRELNDNEYDNMCIFYKMNGVLTQSPFEAARSELDVFERCRRK